MKPERTIRKKIGDLLIEREIITPKQLNEALAEQKRKGGYLSQHLISMRYVAEQDIAMCLSNQYNFGYLPIKNFVIQKEILEFIPLRWIRIYTLLPVDKIGEILSVVMADPLNEGVIEMLKQITNCEIRTFISTYSEINEAIEKYFGDKLKGLKEFYLDAKDLAKFKTANSFIQTKIFKGIERREFVRVNKQLKINFYYHGKDFQEKTIDISYRGVAFNSSIFVPIDTNIVCKIYLKDGQPPIDVVLNTLRAQTKVKVDSREKYKLIEQGYEIAGVFDFMTNEGREALASFLKENIP